MLNAVLLRELKIFYIELISIPYRFYNDGQTSFSVDRAGASPAQPTVKEANPLN